MKTFEELYKEIEDWRIEVIKLEHDLDLRDLSIAKLRKEILELQAERKALNELVRANSSPSDSSQG